MNEEEDAGHKKGLCALVIEDNPDHTELILEAIKANNDLNRIICVKDGNEAMRFLQREGRFGDEQEYPRPGLILLDLKLPGMSGKEVLRRIKSDTVTRSIPVIILTSSSHDKDIEECYNLGANSYITKPISFEEFQRKISAIPSYWTSINTLPQGDSTSGRKILLVDQNANHRELIKADILDEMPDIHIIEAKDAESALDILSYENFDVVILDHRLPDMAGIQFLEESRELRGDAQTVMVTGCATDDVEPNAFKLGIVDYYVKSTELPRMLNQVVKQIFKERSGADQGRLTKEELIDPMVSLLKGF